MKNFFSKKIVKIVSIVVISIIILFGLFIGSVYFLFDINGSDTTIKYNDIYNDEGAIVKYIPIKVSSKSNVDTKKIGTYKVIYSVNILGIKLKKTRIVNVIDKDAPVIKLVGESNVSICPNNSYTEEGYTAEDLYDGDITDKVIRKESIDKIEYEVKDSSNNYTSVIRNIIYEDKESPVIKIKGSSTIYVIYGNKYTEYGYDVSDNCDSDIEVDISSNVNTSIVGKYIVNYTAKDKSGNTSTVSRNVIVTSRGVGNIYLTFDDGPSIYTEKLLNILKDEGVLATFFVTGSGSDYIIKREYNEGHTVALHTNSHNYGYIYSSTDNYFNDLSSIQNRVYNITGVKSNIIRFPGGSNNTVSNSYSYNIMSTLRSMVIEKGYTYFDWNVSSRDAGGCYTSSCVYDSVVNSLYRNRNNVVLIHDTKGFSVDAVRDIIRYGKDNGYVFLPITSSTYPVRFS